MKSCLLSKVKTVSKQFEVVVEIATKIAVMRSAAVSNR